MITFNKLKEKYGYKKAVKIINWLNIGVKLLGTIGVMTLIYITFYILILKAYEHDLNETLMIMLPSIDACVIGFIIYLVYRLDEELKINIIKNQLKTINSLLTHTHMTWYKKEIGNIKLDYNVKAPIKHSLYIEIDDKKLTLYDSKSCKYIKGIWDDEVYDLCLEVHRVLQDMVDAEKDELNGTKYIKEMEELYLHKKNKLAK